MNWDIPVAIAAVYATLISTAALALEIRRWLESGPRLLVTVQAPMITINVPGTEGKTYLVLTVANRGSIPTTLSSMILAEYPTFWHRLRHKPKKAGVIANPSLFDHSLVLPRVLEPGQVWAGYGDYKPIEA